MPKRRTDEEDVQLLLVLSSVERKRGDLPHLLGWSMRKVDRRVSKLQRYNWVNSVSHRRYALTRAGQSELERRSLPQGSHSVDNDALDDLLAQLPSEPHQAFTRLLLCGIVAKHLLLEQRNGPWPGFIMVGDTKAFKTGLAKVICQALGLDAAQHIQTMHTAVAGEFGVRRVRRKGKQGFRAVASALFREPFVCLDEFDKISDAKVKRNAEFFLHGEREFSAEGATFTNRVCPLVIANPDEAGGYPLSRPYIRRSVVLNTDGLTNDLDDVDLVARKVLAWLDRQPRQLIDLDRLRTTHEFLKDKHFRDMRDWFFEQVAQDHRRFVDAAPLELLVLGRLALVPKERELDAIYHVVNDRLICLDTEGQTLAGWRHRLLKRYAASTSDVDPSLLEKIEAEEQRREARRQKVAQAEASLSLEQKEMLRDEMDFVKDREEAVAELKLERDRLPRSKTQVMIARTKPVREQFNRLIRELNKAGDKTRINHILDLSISVKQNLGVLLHELKEEQRAAQVKQAEEAAERKRVSKIKEEIFRLKRLLERKTVKPGEDICARLVEQDCLREEARIHTGQFLPDVLEPYEPDLVKEGLTNKNIPAAWKVGLVFLPELTKNFNPEAQPVLDEMLDSVWRYTVYVESNGQEYARSHFCDWNVARPIIDRKNMHLEHQLLPPELPPADEPSSHND